jgi:hypothetical protein
VSLSQFFTEEDGKLHDKILGASHTLHGAGTLLIQALQTSVSYRQLRDTARLHKVSDLELHALLGFLNKVGGLQRKRSARWLVPSLQRVASHIALGVHYAPLCKRAHPSPTAIAIATLRATTPVILAAGVVASLSWTAGFGPFNKVFVLYASSVIVFVGGVIVHEKAHVKVLEKACVPSSILQLGMHVGIIHRSPAPATEITSALAGPITGAAFCLCAAMGAWLCGAAAAVVSSLAIAVLHLFSLLPYYGDGASLVRALRERNEKL